MVLRAKRRRPAITLFSPKKLENCSEATCFEIYFILSKSPKDRFVGMSVGKTVITQKFAQKFDEK